MSEVVSNNRKWILLPTSATVVLSRPSGRHGKQEELLVGDEIAAALNRAEQELAALRAREATHSANLSVLAGEIADLRMSERTLHTELAALREKVERYEAALTSIACYEDGPVVTAMFDDPYSAEIARDALAPQKPEEAKLT